MELPQELYTLYRHWDNHIHERASLDPDALFLGTASFTDIHAFIQERMRIWERKHTGSTPPYTDDPVLNTYRFCNMLRELDRQTILFHTKLNPLRNNFSEWLLNMYYCRLVARPETIDAVGLLTLDSNHNQTIQEALIKHPRPTYGTPYVFPVSTILTTPYPTRETFITEYVPTVIKTIAEHIQTWNKKSVHEGVQEILPLFGINTHFLWTEVLIDTAYQFPEYIDLYKVFPVGPGAQQTFAQINPDIPPHELAEHLGSLHISSGLTIHNKPISLSAENWEGVGCEYRKYTNLHAGKGRKRIYTKN